MRINRLDLIAFGPFTAKSIDLSEGKQGLHIIFGANEAGKSSSLRALRQLLYGIPSVSSDNFIHEYNNMRIGGQLLHSDGTLLSVVRRKGRSATLRSALDDKPLEDSALSKYLEGLNQNDFESMFGIDHDELIKGGKALCEAKGDLGQILFSAGAGIGNVRTISEKLGEEAKEIFTPTGTKAIINSSIAELKLSAAALKESEVPSSEWETHEKEWRDASDKKAALESTLSSKEQTISKLQRIKEALPLVAQRSQVIEKLEQLKDAAVLQENFGEINRQLQLELRRTSTAEEDASK
ncbi:MAG: AAA family ATPase, partial [Candidatus Obscuribacterales bacterium]|nr:AAA family ATPase [Candidatus Obscuribacterales bacterium]